jgi:putative membrane protein
LAPPILKIFSERINVYEGRKIMTNRSSRILSFFGIIIALIALGWGAARAAALSDNDFVRKAADGDMLEVSLGELAQQQAESPDVKQFGQTMAREHALASNKLLAIAKKDNLAVPMDMDREDHEMVQHLSGLKGRDFDRGYMKHMVEDHKEDIEMFERMATEGANPDLKNYAAETLPTLREHLQTAQDIYSRIGS